MDFLGLEGVNYFNLGNIRLTVNFIENQSIKSINHHSIKIDKVSNPTLSEGFSILYLQSYDHRYCLSGIYSIKQSNDNSYFNGKKLLDSNEMSFINIDNGVISDAEKLATTLSNIAKGRKQIL